MSGELAVKTLQLCFAVYQASAERRPVDPATISTSVSPPWWPPDLSETPRFMESYGHEPPRRGAGLGPVEGR